MTRLLGAFLALEGEALESGPNTILGGGKDAELVLVGVPEEVDGWLMTGSDWLDDDAAAAEP